MHGQKVVTKINWGSKTCWKCLEKSKTKLKMFTGEKNINPWKFKNKTKI